MNEQKYCLFCCMEIGRPSGCDLCGLKAQGKGVTTVPEALPPGTVLDYKYLVGRVLGRSEWAFTYLVRDLHLQQVVVLKEYFPRGLVQRDPDGRTIRPPTEKTQTDQYANGLRQFHLTGRESMRLPAQSEEPPVLQLFRSNGVEYLILQYRNDQAVVLTGEKQYQSILAVDAAPVARPEPLGAIAAPVAKAAYSKKVKHPASEERITGAKTGLKIVIALVVLLLVGAIAGIGFFIARSRTEPISTAANPMPLAPATPVRDAVSPMPPPAAAIPQISPTPTEEMEEATATPEEATPESISMVEDETINEEMETLAKTQLSGQIDSIHIKKVLALTTSKMQRCFRNKTAAKGGVKLQFVINPTGTVGDVILINTSVANAEIEQCLIGYVKALHFPSFVGEAVEVTNTFETPK